jgi:hypothetical protein
MFVNILWVLIFVVGLVGLIYLALFRPWDNVKDIAEEIEKKRKENYH